MNFDSSFWAAICFIIFILLCYKPMKNIILSTLDNRAKKIRLELEEMDELILQSANTLKLYKDHQIRIEKETQEILTNTDLKISRMKENANKDIQEFLNKRTAQITERISAHKDDIIQSLRSQAIENTFKIVDTIISENMTDKISEKLIQTSFEDISKKIH